MSEKHIDSVQAHACNINGISAYQRVLRYIPAPLRVEHSSSCDLSTLRDLAVDLDQDAGNMMGVQIQVKRSQGSQEGFGRW